MVNELVGDMTREMIDYIYNQSQKKHNKKKIKYVIDIFTNLLLSNIKPYFYVILSILILMFFINCLEFYYYIRLFVQTQHSNDIKFTEFN